MKREQSVNALLLDTKVNIPFPPAQVTIYQPSIKEIAMIGEDTQMIAVRAITKNYETLQDKNNSIQLSNFEIFMKVIHDKSEQSKKIIQAIEDFFVLIFPNYKVTFTPRSIILQDEFSQIHMIDESSFNDFTNIIYDAFCLDLLDSEQGTEYNPQGARAQALVDKFMAKRKLLAELKRERGHDPSKDSLYGRYIDILAVGEQKDKNSLKEYSVYQLIEEFKRFQLKTTFDYTLRAKLAGATKIKDAKDWMGDIQFNSENE